MWEADRKRKPEGRKLKEQRQGTRPWEAESKDPRIMLPELAGGASRVHATTLLHVQTLFQCEGSEERRNP